MGVHFQSQYSRDVLSNKGSGSAHAARQCNHQYRVNQFGHSQSDVAGICDDERRSSGSLLRSNVLGGNSSVSTTESYVSLLGPSLAIAMHGAPPSLYAAFATACPLPSLRPI